MTDSQHTDPKPGTNNLDTPQDATNLPLSKKLQHKRRNIARGVKIDSEAQEQKIDSKRSDFDGSAFCGEFKELQLDRSSLQNTRFEVTMDKTETTRPTLRYTDMAGAAIVDCELSGISMRGSRLNDAHIERSDLAFANLGNSSANRLDVKDSTLIHASLNNALFMNSVFSNTQLQNASMDSATCSGSSFLNCNMASASMHYLHAEFARFDNCEMRLSNNTGSTFDNAKLHGCNLRGSDLAEARFLDAELHDCDLRGTHLRATDFRRASLQRVNFHGAHYTADTLWPDGFQPPENAVNGSLLRKSLDRVGQGDHPLHERLAHGHKPLWTKAMEPDSAASWSYMAYPEYWEEFNGFKFPTRIAAWIALIIDRISQRMRASDGFLPFESTEQKYRSVASHMRHACSPATLSAMWSELQGNGLEEYVRRATNASFVKSRKRSMSKTPAVRLVDEAYADSLIPKLFADSAPYHGRTDPYDDYDY